MAQSITTHKIEVVAEDAYSLSDYKEIISLEINRIQRLIDTHDYISEGDTHLAKINQKIQFSYTEKNLKNKREIDIYQRFAANKAFYGVPPRPQRLNDQPSIQPEPYKLAKPKYLSDNEKKLLELINSAEKIVCASASFWAHHHHLVHSKADLSDANYYSWEESAAPVPVDLATSCYRHSPFTFQSWLYYRAQCENDKILIIIDNNQYDWIVSNALQFIPRHAQLIIIKDSTLINTNALSETGIQTNDNRLIFKPKETYRLQSKNEIKESSKLPKISVVVCSYNQCEYLELCLKSIIDQGYPNLELIVVDGNSTDDSISILKRYENQLDLLIIEEDSGQSDALNKGFKRSTGEIMTWVCSDDGLEPGALQKVGRTFLENKNVDIIVGGCRRINQHGRNLSIHHTHLPFNKTVKLSFGDMISFGHTWLRSFYFIQPELFWSRRVWERSGGFIANHMFYAMDYELFLRFALTGAQAYHIHDCLAFALVHEAQKSAHMGRNLPTILSMMGQFRDMADKLNEQKRSLKSESI